MKQVLVTTAQVRAAQAMIRRWETTGRPIRPAVAKIAQAR